jgi:hypothetical protein
MTGNAGNVGAAAGCDLLIFASLKPLTKNARIV